MTHDPVLRRIALAILAAVGVVVADQVSKWVIVAIVMQPPRVIEVTPFFNIVLGFNRGISFGILRETLAAFPETLSIGKLGIVALLAWFLARSDDPWERMAFGLMIGGALGNIIDRLRLGGVVDFLDVHAFGWHWPSFNVADMALTTAAMTMVAGMVRGPRNTP